MCRYVIPKQQTQTHSTVLLCLMRFVSSCFAMYCVDEKTVCRAIIRLDSCSYVLPTEALIKLLLCY